MTDLRTRPLKLLASTSARLTRRRTGTRYAPKAGLSVPIVTIIDKFGRVLEDDQRSVIRYTIQDGFGADIIFAAGTTGEWNRLKNSQTQLVSRIAVDECRRSARNGAPVEAWVGITAHTRADAIDNLAHAIEIKADAVVVAPLSIADVSDPVEFVSKDIRGVFEKVGRDIPVFLYDNADIAASPKAEHIHTRDVKTMSRLEYVHGIKVTAGRTVLGNYTRAARNFKPAHEFGIYPGNAYLIFDLFAPPDGFKGSLRHYWNRYLTRDTLPHGVVAGASNLMPREWQRSWRVSAAGMLELMRRYRGVLESLRDVCEMTRDGKPYRPTIACLKAALADMGVCSSDLVAPGTPPLSDSERREFLRRWRNVQRRAAASLEPEWLSRTEQRRSVAQRLQPSA